MCGGKDEEVGERGNMRGDDKKKIDERDGSISQLVVICRLVVKAYWYSPFRRTRLYFITSYAPSSSHKRDNSTETKPCEHARRNSICTVNPIFLSKQLSISRRPPLRTMKIYIRVPILLQSRTPHLLPNHTDSILPFSHSAILPCALLPF